ncbi:MAG: hypothetical protein EON91_12745 [Brevundimonas sp.]|uniref:hypothetical protein n=1 Tax=Brevundimonas sp. TaxID=1871086 RepID=UPI00121231A1|nr:hypothetical protein [Brevundimonas sp.]RZJ16558.1 MAG: hypothetical protein EON91_12745 [Brevundimonas sp.]
MTDVQPGQEPDQDLDIDQDDDLDQDGATPQPDQGQDITPGQRDQAPATGGEGAAGAGGADGFGTGR